MSKVSISRRLNNAIDKEEEKKKPFLENEVDLRPRLKMKICDILLKIS